MCVCVCVCVGVHARTVFTSCVEMSVVFPSKTPAGDVVGDINIHAVIVGPTYATYSRGDLRGDSSSGLIVSPAISARVIHN